MWFQLLTLLLVAGAFQYYIKLRVWLDWDKQFIYRHAPGPCVQLLKDGGSEDLTHIGNGLVLITTGYGVGTCCGKVLLLDVKNSLTLQELNITNPPSTPNFMASAHGLSTWTDPESGRMTVYVITHPPDEDRIEVFELQKLPSLKHIRTITDKQFGSLNDLVVVDKDKFYITEWSRARDMAYTYIQLFLFQHWGKVYFYDGGKANVVVSGLFSPNGINISPDKSTVYVTEFQSNQLLAYKREASNELTKLWEHEMGTHVDNIEVDPDTGDILIGCHPLNYGILDFFDLFGYTHPSQVLKVKMNKNSVSDVIEVYADPDGSDAYGSSVATYVDGKLIIGTVNRQALVCYPKYIL